MSTDRETLARHYSAPAEFTIPVALRLYCLAAKRFSFPRRRLRVMIDASVNAHRPLLRVRLLHRRRIVWKAAKRVDGWTIPAGYDFLWFPAAGVKQGTRLRLIASISSGARLRAGRLARRPAPGLVLGLHHHLA